MVVVGIAAAAAAVVVARINAAAVVRSMVKVEKSYDEDDDADGVR